MYLPMENSAQRLRCVRLPRPCPSPEQTWEAMKDNAVPGKNPPNPSIARQETADIFFPLRPFNDWQHSVGQGNLADYQPAWWKMIVWTGMKVKSVRCDAISVGFGRWKVTIIGPSLRGWYVVALNFRCGHREQFDKLISNFMSWQWLESEGELQKKCWVVKFCCATWG